MILFCILWKLFAALAWLFFWIAFGFLMLLWHLMLLPFRLAGAIARK